MHGWTRHAGSKYWLGVWKLFANSAVSRNKTNGGRYVLERFVFPARSEEWVAVAEVRVAKRFYSHRLELVAQLEQTGPTHYLKVKPSLRGRADDTIDQKPAGVRAVARRRPGRARRRCRRRAWATPYVPALRPRHSLRPTASGGVVFGALLRCGPPRPLLRSIGRLALMSSSRVQSRLRLVVLAARFDWRPVLRETARGALP